MRTILIAGMLMLLPAWLVACASSSPARTADADPLARQSAAALPFANDQACMEGPLEQFGRYLGDWTIEDSSLGPDGKTWTPGKGARWIFACLGNGTAIQDFWLPTGGGVGTNLRTYNEKTGRWDIAWATKPAPGFAQIEAEQQANGNIVMHYKRPLPNPLRRITFFPPTAQGWRWQLEFSQDEGKTWREVYRINAKPNIKPG